MLAVNSGELSVNPANAPTKNCDWVVPAKNVDEAPPLLSVMLPSIWPVMVRVMLTSEPRSESNCVQLNEPFNSVGPDSEPQVPPTEIKAAWEGAANAIEPINAALAIFTIVFNSLLLGNLNS